MATLFAILDTNEGNTCDDCGARIRYEYHTSNGGRYGSKCIHRHIHSLGWLTFKARADFGMFAKIEKTAERMADAMSREPSGILYIPSARYLVGAFHRVYTTYKVEKFAAEKAVEILLGNGWKIEKAHSYHESDPGRYYISWGQGEQ